MFFQTAYSNIVKKSVEETACGAADDCLIKSQMQSMRLSNSQRTSHQMVNTSTGDSVNSVQIEAEESKSGCHCVHLQLTYEAFISNAK
jgi:hypothetical protein